eukprot:TRINITY_DN4828_c0_g1_i2.p1 TRINITY_DN4828_c0_g1~~TRINITY_DN4828_c0_g1_i2.p1  ORF type:complete len:504 (+),score=127.55 TRINITY_DN4828_c0_g1_i2:141-1652(+)
MVDNSKQGASAGKGQISQAAAFLSPVGSGSGNAGQMGDVTKDHAEMDEAERLIVKELNDLIDEPLEKEKVSGPPGSSSQQGAAAKDSRGTKKGNKMTPASPTKFAESSPAPMASGPPVMAQQAPAPPPMVAAPPQQMVAPVHPQPVITQVVTTAAVPPTPNGVWHYNGSGFSPGLPAPMPMGQPPMQPQPIMQLGPPPAVPSTPWTGGFGAMQAPWHHESKDMQQLSAQSSTRASTEAEENAYTAGNPGWGMPESQPQWSRPGHPGVHHPHQGVLVMPGGAPMMPWAAAPPPPLLPMQHPPPPQPVQQVPPRQPAPHPPSQAAQAQQQQQQNRQQQRDGKPKAMHSRFLAQFHRTEPCRFFDTGCRNGNNCPFAHGREQLQNRPNLWKTSLCTRWQAWNCPYPVEECSFAHGHQDLHVTHSYLKTVLCKDFIKDRCQLGNKCRHAHGYGELQSAGNRLSSPRSSKDRDRRSSGGKGGSGGGYQGGKDGNYNYKQWNEGEERIQ